MAAHACSAFPIARRCRQNSAVSREGLGMDGSSVTDAALRQDYLYRAQELVPMLLAAGDETEKHRQVPEPIVAAMVARGILAWGPELPGAGKCVAVEGGYRVTGRWGFATGSRHASWLGAHCPVFEADGSPRLGANGRQVVRTMLAPKSEATIIDNWQVLGLRGTGSDSYEFKDHFVPEARTAIRDNAAERRETGPLYQFTSGLIYAMSFSHVSLGIARGAYDAFIEIARDKVPRGARGTLRSNHVIQAQV